MYVWYGGLDKNGTDFKDGIVTGPLIEVPALYVNYTPQLSYKEEKNG